MWHYGMQQRVQGSFSGFNSLVSHIKDLKRYLQIFYIRSVCRNILRGQGGENGSLLISQDVGSEHLFLFGD